MTDQEYTRFLERRVDDLEAKLQAAHRVMMMNVRDAAALVAALTNNKSQIIVDLREARNVSL